jgi:hypothetical protein
MRHSAVIHFRRNMLDLARRKTNIRAHDVLDATIESLVPPKIFAKIDRPYEGAGEWIDISTFQSTDRWIGAPLCEQGPHS